ncbi:MAG: hypothetical protein AAGG48_23620 [Planctomycetota bacterium]
MSQRLEDSNCTFSSDRKMLPADVDPSGRLVGRLNQETPELDRHGPNARDGTVSGKA